MQTKNFSIISTFIALILFGALIFFSLPQNSNNEMTQNNVFIVDGKQIVEITAKGGYLPRTTLAKANIPTIIKVKTIGTFDCSSALMIPRIGYQKYLPASGETLIEIPEQKAGSILKGICSMGMYSFVVEFGIF